MSCTRIGTRCEHVGPRYCSPTTIPSELVSVRTESFVSTGVVGVRTETLELMECASSALLLDSVELEA